MGQGEGHEMNTSFWSRTPVEINGDHRDDGRGDDGRAGAGQLLLLVLLMMIPMWYSVE